MTKKKRLTFKEKLRVIEDENRKNKLRTVQTLKNVIFLMILIFLYITKFKDIYWLIYPLFFFHLAKLCWMATYEDKTQVKVKDAVWGYYAKVREFVIGKGCDDEDIQTHALINPFYRVTMVIFSLIYIVKMKSSSIYMYMFFCISLTYLLFSYDIKFIRKNIVSQKTMYGGNLYFAVPLAILLCLEYKNNSKKNQIQYI